jgi:hypothetical protein
MNCYRILGLSILFFFTVTLTGISIAQPGGSPQGAPADQGEEANPPVIDSIKITGATKIATKDILAGISMKVGQKISRTLVKNTCNEIAAMYQKKGGDAAVTPDITHPADGHVVVELIVDENGKGGFLWPATGKSGGAPGGGAPGSAPPDKPAKQ